MRSTGLALAFCALLSPVAALRAADTTPADAAVGPTTTPPGTDGIACVDLVRIRSTRVLDDRTIVFDMGGGRMLVNRLPRTCHGLGFEKAFGYETSLHKLCNLDIIWVVTDHGFGSHCGLGMFEPYVKPEKITAPSRNGTLNTPK